MTDKIYYGETPCQGMYKKNSLPCRNNSYYKVNEIYLCGMHSKKFTNRVTLPENPNKDRLIQERIDNEAREVELAAESNNLSGFKGEVICSKLKMYSHITSYKGFRRVYPNFRHQDMNDGYGCKSLSPMVMGPIVHNQPDLPIALNLENFHQGNKVFSSEVDENRDPSPKFYTTQINMYTDNVPHRRKLTVKRGDVPLYSVWNGKKFNYIESRQFYCNYYERFALQSKDFRILSIMRDKGVNLQICGYDAYPITKSVEECYLDPSKPFGHEMVLYTMLTVEDPEQWPWRMHKTEDF